MANNLGECGKTMTHEKKTKGHTYTVQLRFSGEQLDPSEVSARLNLVSSNSSRQLENQPSTRKRRPYWAYNGQGEEGFQPEWACLEDGLKFLLKILSPRKSEIIALAGQYEAVWWCGHFQASFDGGPTLSPKLLTEIGSYEVCLSIDNYFSDE